MLREIVDRIVFMETSSLKNFHNSYKFISCIQKNPVSIILKFTISPVGGLSLMWQRNCFVKLVSNFQFFRLSILFCAYVFIIFVFTFIIFLLQTHLTKKRICFLVVLKAFGLLRLLLVTGEELLCVWVCDWLSEFISFQKSIPYVDLQSKSYDLSHMPNRKSIRQTTDTYSRIL